LYGLALAIANGVPWLGRFATAGGRVLFLDNELHREELSYRINQVSEAAGLAPDDVEVASLRGKGVDYVGLGERMRSALRPGRYTAVIMDSHYRMLPAGTDENANGAIKDVYNVIDSLAARTHATWFLAHHSSKGDQSEKEVVDVGAGASAQARACDTHLILRPYKDKDAYTLEAVVRSFEPVTPLVVRWEYPLLVADDGGLDAGDLRTPRTRITDANRAQDTRAIMKYLAGQQAPVTANVVAGALGRDRGRCQGMLEDLVAQGLACGEEIVTGGKQATGYSIKK
jgi:hypothetical protein